MVFPSLNIWFQCYVLVFRHFSLIAYNTVRSTVLVYSIHRHTLMIVILRRKNKMEIIKINFLLEALLCVEGKNNNEIEGRWLLNLRKTPQWRPVLKNEKESHYIKRKTTCWLNCGLSQEALSLEWVYRSNLRVILKLC